MEGGAGVAVGDANELDSAPISSEGANKGVVFLGLLGELDLEADVPSKADLEKDEGAVLAVEGVEVLSGIGWHPSDVDNVRGGSHSCRYQVVEVFLWEEPSPYVPGGRHTFFVILRGLSLHKRFFVNMDTSPRRFLRSVGGGPGGANHRKTR
jgi:hypothetical protein